MEELDNNSMSVLAVYSPSEVSGTTYMNYTTELSNNKRYNARYIQNDKVIADQQMSSLALVSQKQQIVKTAN